MISRQRPADWWRAFLIAARFLTRAPLPDPAAAAVPRAADSGRAALLYPLVGLLLGVFLAALAWLLSATPTPVAATLVLTAWVWGTGALHLDGLSDCADAWVGGLGDRARTLAILKDPHLGAMGAVALMLALLAKWSALWALLAALVEPIARPVMAAEAGHGMVLEPGALVLEQGGMLSGLAWAPVLTVLLLVPALSRLHILLLALTTPGATETGMGAALRASLPRMPAWGLALGCWLLAGAWMELALGQGLAWLLWLAVAGLTLLLWRAALIHRLGGFTGDGAGALVEMTEVALLLAAAMLLG